MAMGPRSLPRLQCRYTPQEIPLFTSPLCLCRGDPQALLLNHGAMEALASNLPLPSSTRLLG